MIYKVNDYRNMWQWKVLQTNNNYGCHAYATWNDFTQQWLVDTIKSLNKPVIMFQHGRFAMMDYGEKGYYKRFHNMDVALKPTADKIMVWGQTDKDWLVKETGYNENDIVITGHPQFDNIAMKEYKPKDTLVYGFAPMHWEVEVLKENKQAIELICQNKRKEEMLIIKSMEEIVLGLSDEYMKTNNIEVINTDTKKDPEDHKKKTDEFYEKVDCLFAIDTSTFVLHAHLRGIPVPFIANYDNRPLYVPDWMKVVYDCTKKDNVIDNIKETMQQIREAKFELPTQEELDKEILVPSITAEDLDKIMSEKLSISNDIQFYEKDKLNILVIPIDDTGCFFYRAFQPMSILKEQMPEKINYTIDNHLFEEMVGMCDVILVQRAYHEDILLTIKSLMKKDAIMVYDVDDSYFDMHYKHESKKEFESEENNLIIRAFCKAADVVTTTTEYIANVYRRYAKRVEVLPNCIDFSEWDKHYEARQKYLKEQKPELPDNHVAIGFHGGESHHYDIAMISMALCHLLRTRNNVFFYTVGFDVKQYFEFNPYQNKILCLPGVYNAKTFGQTLVEFDIGIAPLMDTEFNRCRSAIKFCEYSALGIPTVATNIKPYAGVIEHNVTGLLTRNTKTDWINHLTRLIDKPELRTALGENARKFVKKHYDIRDKVIMWYDLYCRLIAEKKAKNEGVAT